MPAWLSDLGQRLPQIALAFLAAKRGGPEALAAFQGGLQEAQAQRQALVRQSQLDEERRQDFARQRGFQERQEARAVAGEAQDTATAKAQAARQAIATALGLSNTIREEATDPVAGEQQFQSQIGPVAEAAGMAPGALDAYMPRDLTGHISQRNLKAAQTWAQHIVLTVLPAARKAAAEDGQVLDDTTVSQQWDTVPPAVQAIALAQGHKAGTSITLSEIQGVAALPEYITRPSGTRRKGASNLVPKDVSVNGKRRLVNYDPEKGEYYNIGSPDPITEDIQEYDKPTASSADTGPLESVIGPDGTPILMTRTQALGRRRASGSDKAASGLEKRALNFFNRAKQADEDVEPIEADIAKLSLAGQARLQWAPNFAQTQLGQVYTQAQRAFTEARLRKDSGAAIPPHEYAADKQTYFAQPGDSPDTLAQKRRGRAAVLASLGFESGQALSEFLGGPDDAKAVVESYKIRSARPTATAPVGTKRTFPNGRTATWDGRGWKAD